MRRRLLTCIAALPVATVAACGTGHSAAKPASAAPSPTPVVLTFAATPGGGSGVDNPPKGPSVGDEFFEHGRLTGTGGQSGTYVLTTQLVAGNAEHGQEQQAITLHLHDGDITTIGAIATADEFTVAVIGGTGSYAGARGEMTVRSAAHDTETLIVRLEK